MKLRNKYISKNTNKIKVIFILILYIYIISIYLKKYEEINNNLKVCLCLICKEERLYIRDFLDYYKKLGFNHIFLYDNNDKNGEDLKEVIYDYIIKKFVTYINYHDIKGSLGGPIMSAYYDCYQRNNLIYNWIAFFDVDEYLILKPENFKIQDFLINKRYIDCEAIKINWRIFTDNNKIYYEKGPLNKRFKKPSLISKKANEVTKIIIRGNLSNYALRKSYDAHEIFYSNKSCDTNGHKRKGPRINPPIYNFAILNHYFTKTIKEYISKIKRGHAYYQWKINKTVLDFYLSAFFRYNIKNKKKLSIFNNAFNTTYK